MKPLVTSLVNPKHRGGIICAVAWGAVCVFVVVKLAQRAAELYSGGSPNQLPLLIRVVLDVVCATYSEFVLAGGILALFLFFVWRRPDESKPFFGASFVLVTGLAVGFALFLMVLPLILFKLRNL